ncbi:hypothetical protein B0H13DRAFT_2365971 [Mycena leptocephala]|nr:hypothetical protein B0H13DRAFT_2365971 [Mycena leptocephala]
MAPPQATVNCDMGEGFSLYTIADDEVLMQTIPSEHRLWVHAFCIMNKPVTLAKQHGVLL